MKSTTTAEPAAPAPQPEHVVAVRNIEAFYNSLTWELMASKSVDGLRAGESRRLYGLYHSNRDNTTTWYIDGEMPAELRASEFEEGEGKELLFCATSQLPATISEIVQEEYEGEYVPILILPELEYMKRPHPEGKVLQFTPPSCPMPVFTPLCGNVRMHPATAALQGKGQLEFTFSEPQFKQPA